RKKGQYPRRTLTTVEGICQNVTLSSIGSYSLEMINHRCLGIGQYSTIVEGLCLDETL
ncbi:hypothetical protein TorRG33x02_343170, partial [Trema orientale]